MRQIKESLEIIQYNKIGKEDYRPKIQKYVVNSINDAKKIFANSHELDKIDKVEVKDNGKVIYTIEIIPPSNTSKRYSTKWKKETKMNIKQLVEAANRKCEMRWKVLAFNPDKDNELVGEFKDFNCIDCAAQKKRELLAKNPNYTVEIIAEAIAKARIDIGNDDIDDAYMDVNYAISRDTNYKLKDFKKESAQKNEGKVNMSKLKNEVQAAVNKYFKDDKDLLEYVYIDTKKDKFGRDILEVRAELDYNSMVKLADYLDKIVTKYDKYAYFDQETSGTMVAVFESAQKNEDKKGMNALKKLTKENKFIVHCGGYAKYCKTRQEAEAHAKAIKAGQVKDLLGHTIKCTEPVKIEEIHESAQKNESWSDLYPVVAEIGTDWEFYKKKPKYTRNELKQAAITKLKAKGKSFNSQDLEEALNRWYTSESAQINETRGYKVIVELGVPDNMNNRDIEDEVERLLRASHKIDVVMDVTATRQ